MCGEDHAHDVDRVVDLRRAGNRERRALDCHDTATMKRRAKLRARSWCSPLEIRQAGTAPPWRMTLLRRRGLARADLGSLLCMAEDLELVATVSNEAEAEMVAERLSEAGIRFTVRLASGGIRLGAAAARDLFVAAQDLDRAREVLALDEGFSEEELARLSDEAGERALDEPT